MSSWEVSVRLCSRLASRTIADRALHFQRECSSLSTRFSERTVTLLPRLSTRPSRRLRNLSSPSSELTVSLVAISPALLCSFVHSPPTGMDYMYAGEHDSTRNSLEFGKLTLRCSLLHHRSTWCPRLGPQVRSRQPTRLRGPLPIRPRRNGDSKVARIQRTIYLPRRPRRRTR